MRLSAICRQKTNRLMVGLGGQKAASFLEPLPSYIEVRVPLGGPFGTVPELLFEKKGLIPNLQQLLIS